MGKRKKKIYNKVKGTIVLIFAIICVIVKVIWGYDIVEILSENTLANQNSVDIGNTIELVPATMDSDKKDISVSASKNNTSIESDLKVYFVDVGQADCILIKNNGKNMLIDAGNNNDGKLLVNYFQSLGIQKFDYIVGTHPHEDHIGGLDDIIENFDIENVLMPKATTTTATYEDVLDALLKKKLKVKSPKVGENFNVGDCNFTVLSVGKNEEDLNRYSIVLKMQFGNESFLFTGDATKENEENMLDFDISADVLKVGHHGSSYSSSTEFLDKVNPKYAIISVGKGNKYGHPTQSTLKNLKKRNIEIYRTDEKGTILITSDGNNINFENFKTNTNGG